MPLEIRELLIKTTVTNNEKREPRPALHARDLQDIKTEIVAECLEKMREELLKNKER